ncbi:LRP2 [Mytilus edulis]|uniref:LRP2 n=1 Tax=Mytilus edulis TaxID=6550 RepID=A0A8S3VBB9_MYTED|nr:LRP2 [Mytilus edulis]
MLPISDYKCRDEDVKCADGRQCIWKPAVCNDYIACNDGSDESEATCKENIFIKNGNVVKAYYDKTDASGVHITIEGAQTIRVKLREFLHPKMSPNQNTPRPCDTKRKLSDISLTPMSAEKDNYTCKYPGADLKCADDLQCFSFLHLCDGKRDCNDGSDETFHVCKTRNCGWRERSCDNGNCVYIRQFCDGKDDCGDNSDEREPCFRNNY